MRINIVAINNVLKEKKLQNQILNQLNIIKKLTNIILKNKEIFEKTNYGCQIKEI